MVALERAAGSGLGGASCGVHMLSIRFVAIMCQTTRRLGGASAPRVARIWP